MNVSTDSLGEYALLLRSSWSSSGFWLPRHNTFCRDALSSRQKASSEVLHPWCSQSPITQLSQCYCHASQWQTWLRNRSESKFLTESQSWSWSLNFWKLWRWSHKLKPKLKLWHQKLRLRGPEFEATVKAVFYPWLTIDPFYGCSKDIIPVLPVM